MDAIQYGVNYHSNKTSLAKRLHGTVESSFTATPSTIMATPLQQPPTFFVLEDSLSGGSKLSEKGGLGGRVSKN